MRRARRAYVLVCFGRVKQVRHAVSFRSVLRNRIHQAHDAAHKVTKEVKPAHTTSLGVILVVSVSLHHYTGMSICDKAALPDTDILVFAQCYPPLFSTSSYGLRLTQIFRDIKYIHPHVAKYGTLSYSGQAQGPKDCFLVLHRQSSYSSH